MEKAVKYPRLVELLRGSTKLGQREIARACYVKQSSVSGWFNGHKRPRPLPLAHLAETLAIPSESLLKACGYSIRLSIPNINSETTNDQQEARSIEFVSYILSKAKELNDIGLPTFANDLCVSSLGQLSQSSMLSRNSLGEKSRTLGANLLATQGRILCEYLPPPVAAVSMHEIDIKLSKLAEASEGIEVNGLKLTNLACIEYIRGRHRRSLQYNLEALDCVDDIDWKTDILRAIVISMAKLGFKSEMLTYENQLKHLLEDLKSDNGARSFGYEGLARAHALIGSDLAMDYFDEAKQDGALSAVLKLPRRKIQLLRSEATILGQLGESRSSARDQVLTAGYDLAITNGYSRYAQEFNSMRRA